MQATGRPVGPERELRMSKCPRNTVRVSKGPGNAAMPQMLLPGWVMRTGRGQQPRSIFPGQPLLVGAERERGRPIYTDSGSSVGANYPGATILSTARKPLPRDATNSRAFISRLAPRHARPAGPPFVVPVGTVALARMLLTRHGLPESHRLIVLPTLPCPIRKPILAAGVDAGPGSRPNRLLARTARSGL